MSSIKHVSQKALVLISLIATLSSGILVQGQTLKGNKQSAVTKVASSNACSAAWTGSISYSQTQSTSSHKEVERVSGRGLDTTEFEMKYDYKAQVAVLAASEKNGSSIGRASINHWMSSTEHIEATEKNSCDRGKTWREMRGSSLSKTETTGSQGHVEASVNVGVNEDGTYAVSVGLPPIKGKVSGSQTSTFSGQCTAKEGKNLSLPATETRIDGHGLTSDGSDKINEKSPNKISGSYSLKTPGNVVETIQWNLQKCGSPLRITDLKFEDMKFPKWNDWREITEQVGTIDGNLVKIKATVLNDSGESKSGSVGFKETFKGDKWDGAKPDMPLKSDFVDFDVEPGELKEVEFVWNSSGYSWYDDGRPRLVERVKAEIWQKNKLIDDMTKNLKVAPKPLVLVHGAWSHWKEFETWQNILTISHSYDWKAFPVGEVTNKGIMNTGRDITSSEQTNSTEQNAVVLRDYIKYAHEDRNAWHVDVVAHQIGGLIARYYIQNLMPASQDGIPQIEHLIMLGTPNLGSPCADVMDLTFRLTGGSPRVVQEMRQDSVAEFNKRVSNRRGVKFSALAGSILPTTCKQIEWNDGFVTVPSAIASVADHAEMQSLSADLTGTAAFSDFVKPRVAIGPRGNHNPDVPVAGVSNP